MFKTCHFRHVVTFLFKSRFLLSHIDRTWNYRFSLTNLQPLHKGGYDGGVPHPLFNAFSIWLGWLTLSLSINKSELLHFVLEEITSPFHWCKAFRANSILTEYNGSTPNEGQSVLGIICFTKYLFKLLSNVSKYIPHFHHTVSSIASVHRLLQGQYQLP